MFVTGLVLAAGASVRLGEAKQLLPYRGRTLLDATLDLARSCAFDQVLVTLGGAADLVRERVDLTGVQVVENSEFSTGCGSSVRAATQAVDPRADGLVLLLGDQPGVRAADVRRVAAATTPLAVCRYADGLGHPFWFASDVLPELRVLHGDKAVWKLLHSGRHPVTEIPVDGPVPIDVDTRADYRRLLSGEAR
ncbi:nucleotidyltransferase family protein [Micromonospora sp. WMMD718]|uniref:nucleotidyltransferase family protein n=1 Tax=Micromonospora sp. WMMD718 TaxID=3016098 RepID=UPI0024173B1C|nr:nucleotidyltransferase family protein [Micromonospora sp. WMMD718]MDG4750334.1 nucleotidyltransferase family protein [Micromonospora sp. WMMD718]